MRRSIALLLLTTAACSGPTSALGYRARQAAIQRDAEAFGKLMEEAAGEKTPEDDPQRTVLTHFLDLADHPRFASMLDAWRSRGWVHEDMSCAIDRALYRASAESDPVAADRAAQRAVDRARKAATDPKRKWELEECLAEAPFLVDTSTAALVPYLKIAIDPSEPLDLRTGLLDGMSRVYLTGAARLAGNEGISREEASRRAGETAAAQAARLDWIVAAVKSYVEAPLLSRSTARGALELENVLVGLGQSWLAGYAASADPYDRDLAWGWVRTLKEGKKIERIAALGLWNESKEGERDAYWYLCASDQVQAKGGVLGTIKVVDAIAIRAAEPVTDRDGLSSKHCASLGTIVGPYPLESTARGALLEALPGEDAGTSVRITERKVEE